ncbi:Hep/Hag repeat protein [[Eubacterium] siraeum DSM 15702]|uniref:Hep/Hag repeat protein n=1 Tax=[Eubacterium] siraeum DSM 15702 TaxID=428128 RepID=B0MKT5_9FIRM|nr:Hep/Hag repeat protein [[Eubacterium] siraeum DSM 15702]UWP24672.1 hypothetical protein NQ549_09070 [[Eubacterium] siraeum]
MIVRVYDFLSAEKPKFSQNLVGIVSDVERFKYTRRAYDIGSFEMTIPTHADEAGCIQPDRMLIVGEKLGQTYIASDPTKRIVNGTFLYVTDIEKKDDKITVTGYDLKYLFALRVTLFPKEEQDKGTYGYYVTSGTTFACISDIVNYNIVNATDSDRQIFGMFSITMPVSQINADPPLTGIQDDRYMTRLEPVSTAIFNLLKNCKTHFYDMRLIIDDNAEDGDNYNPHMESSEDKPVIIIDESRYNIKSYTRKDGTSAYKNAIYAVVGSGDDVTIKCVKRPDDTASGVKRKEVVLDVDTDSVAEIDRYALKAAEEYVISDDFEIEPLFMDDETEPELAQKVSIRIDGVEYETVITEITDEYANGKHTQSYACGDKKLKVLNVLNKATAGNTQKIINNKITTGNAGGVGKFTNTDRNCEVFNDYENNVASAYYSHAEGYMTTANAPYSHAEGSNTVASNLSCHAEGSGTTASGNCSHAENTGCIASGSNSHAEGYYTIARGEHSHASGAHTIAGMEVFALGKYNKKAEDVALVVGNGWGNDSHEYRSDALTLDYSGNLILAGNLTANSPGWDYLGAEIHGAVRFGNNWTSDSTSILLAVGNGADSKNLRDALTLDSDGNLHISGKFTADGGVGYVIPTATADTLGGVMIGDNINVSDSGTISVNLSAYLKNTDIADWAKAESKPVYTAEEVGAAEKNHTHNMSDITDMPEWTKTENKPAYTASEVGAATAADITAAVNAVEIGGRNLLYDSTGNIKNGWSGTTVINVGGGISGNSLAISRTGYSGNARYFGISKRHFLTDFNVGTSYTLSAWIKVRSDVGLDASGYVMARFRSADDKKLYALSLTVGVDTVKDKWLYYKKTWTINDSDIAKLECVALALDKNGMIEACNIKLEKGTKATDWSPAVEEDTERIASLEARVAALEAVAVSGGEV